MAVETQVVAIRATHQHRWRAVDAVGLEDGAQPGHVGADRAHGIARPIVPGGPHDLGHILGDERITTSHQQGEEEATLAERGRGAIPTPVVGHLKGTQYPEPHAAHRPRQASQARLPDLRQ